jgi:hypothetical protein
MKLGHNRDISFKTRRIADDRVKIVSELRDWRRNPQIWPRWKLIHHMKVELTIDPQMVIQDASFQTLSAPYRECRQYVVSAERLLGVSLSKGFTKKVNEIYGGVCGCSHILTLLTNVASAGRQGFAFTYMFPEDEKQLNESNLVPMVKKMADFVADTCMVWKSDSEVQKDIARGHVRSLPERLFPAFARKMGSRLKRFR